MIILENVYKEYPIVKLILWIFLPFCNLFICFQYGRQQYLLQHPSIANRCEEQKSVLTSEDGLSSLPARSNMKSCTKKHISTNCDIRLADIPFLEVIPSEELLEFRNNRLAPLPGEDFSFLIKQQQQVNCTIIKHHHMTLSTNCFGIVRLDSQQHTEPLKYTTALRFNEFVSEEGYNLLDKTFKKLPENTYNLVSNTYNKGMLHPAGLFRKVPKRKGRLRIREKLKQMFTHYIGINNIVKDKLNQYNITKGDNVVIMVLNEGRLPLLLYHF